VVVQLCCSSVVVAAIQENELAWEFEGEEFDSDVAFPSTWLEVSQ
jgi:hypothetical protein